MAELLGEGDGRKAIQEGPGDSVKFEGGEDASVAVEWSGVSLLTTTVLNSEAVFPQVCTGYESCSTHQLAHPFRPGPENLLFICLFVYCYT